MPTLTPEQPLQFTTWGAELRAGEDNLFIEGYRAWAKNPCEIGIHNPDGTRYAVNPYQNSCTCPAGQKGLNCKHRKQLVSLVHLTMAEFEFRSDFRQWGNLRDTWGDFTDWKAAQERKR